MEIIKNEGYKHNTIKVLSSILNMLAIIIVSISCISFSHAETTVQRFGLNFVLHDDYTATLTSYTNAATGWSTINIPDVITENSQNYTVTQINGHALFSLPWVENISFGDHAILGVAPFAGMYHLTSFSVNSTNPNYSTVNGVLYSKDMKTLIAYPAGKSGTSFTIPSTVETVAQQAFFTNRYITTVNIPSSVKSLEPGAFQYSRTLTTVNLPTTKPYVDALAFGGCKTTPTVTCGTTSYSTIYKYIADNMVNFDAGSTITVSSETELNNAIAAAGTNPTTIVLSQSMSGNFIIPDGAKIRLTDNGNGYTLTSFSRSGTVDAQCLSLSGTTTDPISVPGIFVRGYLQVDGDITFTGSETNGFALSTGVLVIHNATVTGFSTSGVENYGGTVCVTKGDFHNNGASGTGINGGGLSNIGPATEMYINNAAIYNNSSPSYGGGIATCPTGNLQIIGNPISLYNNHASVAGDDILLQEPSGASQTLAGARLGVTIPTTALGGGNFNWYKDTSSVNYDNGSRVVPDSSYYTNTFSETALHSTLSQADFETSLSKATVKLYDNKRGVTSNGYLYFDEVDTEVSPVEVEIPVTKTESGKTDLIPDTETYNFTISAVTPGAPMPEQTSLSITHAALNDADTTNDIVRFVGMEFDESDIGNTYIYNIKETAGSLKDMAYDRTVWQITIIPQYDSSNNIVADPAIIPVGGTEKDIVSFNNSYNPLTTLALSKTVCGPSGNRYNKFLFTIKMVNGATNYSGTLQYTGTGIADGALVFNSNGEATIQLSHNQSILLKNVPVGNTYTITEQAVNGYMTYVGGTIQSNGTVSGGTKTNTTQNTLTTAAEDVHYINYGSYIPNNGMSQKITPFILLALLGVMGVAGATYYRFVKKRTQV